MKQHFSQFNAKKSRAGMIKCQGHAGFFITKAKFTMVAFLKVILSI
jgi:hypothetical protein